MTFKDEMEKSIIPHVLKLAEKEKNHLNWLIENNAPEDLIDSSRNYLIHYLSRYEEYKRYIKKEVD